VNIPDANFKNYLLSRIDINSNEDDEIQVSEALAVQNLEISEFPQNLFSSLEGLEAFANATQLNMSVSLPEIDLSILPQLMGISITDSELVNLNLDGLVNLRSITLQFDRLTALDLSELSNLESLHLSMSRYLNSIIIGNNINLNNVNIFTMQLTELDLSGCPNLENLRAWFNVGGQDVYVNLKNGNTEYLEGSLVHLNGLESRIFICIDEGELENLSVDINALVSTYCTFTPGGDYNVITGSLLFDNDGNCDSNGTVISNIKLNINDGAESGSAISSTGLYNFYTQAGNFTITPDFENDHFTITPPFAEVNFTAVDSIVSTQNFCLTPNGNHPDLDIVIVPFGARPGFDSNYKIIYRNKGNQTLSGDIMFTYQEDVLDFVSANPANDSSSTGELVWNYTGLAPFQQREIYVTLNLNGPMEIPAVNIDDQLEFNVTINPVSGDDTPLDNAFGLKETVIGSFDPNDITCLDGERVHPEKIGEYLHYNINFENTGTAQATFIVVKNEINTAQFDMDSFQMINASRPVQAKITGNKIEFRFDDINLGPEGKGNVVYKIRSLNTLQANDDVSQQAEIFFDYNWPIETNEATTIFQILGREDFDRDHSVKVYPNPSDGIVTISASSMVKSLELYDIQGRLLQAGSNTLLDISGRAAGMYFVKVQTEAGVKVEKVFRK